MFFFAVDLKDNNTIIDKTNIPLIIELVNTNDLKGVEEILLNGSGKIEEVDENGMTPLQHAAYKGQLDMCKLLIRYGGDVNTNSHEHNYSPLHFGALSGNTDVVKLLLSSGAKSYHTNSLKRTAAQMAGFVGNHHISALINNFLPLSSIEHYTIPQGLETEPRLKPKVAENLYNLVMKVNLHPVYIAMNVGKINVLVNNISSISKVLNLMCEKEVKKSENVNEILCLKLHFISYVLKTLEKELDKQTEKVSEEKEKKEDRLLFETIIKKWLTGRSSDGFEEYLEYYVRDAIKAFPYVEMPLFMQVVRNIAMGTGDSWTLGILHSIINGQKGFDDNIYCSSCGTESKEVKKCSKCKMTQYCNRTCQRIHWHTHKKFCDKLLKEYLMIKEKEMEKEKSANGNQQDSQVNITPNE